MTEFSSTGKPISETGGYDEVRSGGGTTSYWLNGALHHETGPALVTRDGDEHWYRNGLRHRTDGPAIVTRNGAQMFFVDGVTSPPSPAVVAV